MPEVETVTTSSLTDPGGMAAHKDGPVSLETPGHVSKQADTDITKAGSFAFSGKNGQKRNASSDICHQQAKKDKTSQDTCPTASTNLSTEAQTGGQQVAGSDLTGTLAAQKKMPNHSSSSKEVSVEVIDLESSDDEDPAPPSQPREQTSKPCWLPLLNIAQRPNPTDHFEQSFTFQERPILPQFPRGTIIPYNARLDKMKSEFIMLTSVKDRLTRPPDRLACVDKLPHEFRNFLMYYKYLIHSGKEPAIGCSRSSFNRLQSLRADYEQYMLKYELKGNQQTSDVTDAGNNVIRTPQEFRNFEDYYWYLVSIGKEEGPNSKAVSKPKIALESKAGPNQVISQPSSHLVTPEENPAPPSQPTKQLSDQQPNQPLVLPKSTSSSIQPRQNIVKKSPEKSSQCYQPWPSLPQQDISGPPDPNLPPLTELSDTQAWLPLLNVVRPPNPSDHFEHSYSFQARPFLPNFPADTKIPYDKRLTQLKWEFNKLVDAIDKLPGPPNVPISSNRKPHEFRKFEAYFRYLVLIGKEVNPPQQCITLNHKLKQLKKNYVDCIALYDEMMSNKPIVTSEESTTGISNKVKRPHEFRYFEDYYWYLVSIGKEEGPNSKAVSKPKIALESQAVSKPKIAPDSNAGPIQVISQPSSHFLTPEENPAPPSQPTKQLSNQQPNQPSVLPKSASSSIQPQPWVAFSNDANYELCFFFQERPVLPHFPRGTPIPFNSRLLKMKETFDTLIESLDNNVKPPSWDVCVGRMPHEFRNFTMYHKFLVHVGKEMSLSVPRERLEYLRKEYDQYMANYELNISTMSHTYAPKNARRPQEFRNFDDYYWHLVSIGKEEGPNLLGNASEVTQNSQGTSQNAVSTSQISKAAPKPKASLKTKVVEDKRWLPLLDIALRPDLTDHFELNFSFQERPHLPQFPRGTQIPFNARLNKMKNEFIMLISVTDKLVTFPQKSECMARLPHEFRNFGMYHKYLIHSGTEQVIPDGIASYQRLQYLKEDYNTYMHQYELEVDQSSAELTDVENDVIRTPQEFRNFEDYYWYLVSIGKENCPNPDTVSKPKIISVLNSATKPNIAPGCNAGLNQNINQRSSHVPATNSNQFEFSQPLPRFSYGDFLRPTIPDFPNPCFPQENFFRPPNPGFPNFPFPQGAFFRPPNPGFPNFPFSQGDFFHPPNPCFPNIPFSNSHFSEPPVTNIPPPNPPLQVMPNASQQPEQQLPLPNIRGRSEQRYSFKERPYLPDYPPGTKIDFDPRLIKLWERFDMIINKTDSVSKPPRRALCVGKMPHEFRNFSMYQKHLIYIGEEKVDPIPLERVEVLRKEYDQYMSYYEHKMWRQKSNESNETDTPRDTERNPEEFRKFEDYYWHLVGIGKEKGPSIKGNDPQNAQTTSVQVGAPTPIPPRKDKIFMGRVSYKDKAKTARRALLAATWRTSSSYSPDDTHRKRDSSDRELRKGSSRRRSPDVSERSRRRSRSPSPKRYSRSSSPKRYSRSPSLKRYSRSPSPKRYSRSSSLKRYSRSPSPKRYSRSGPSTSRRSPQRSRSPSRRERFYSPEKSIRSRSPGNYPDRARDYSPEKAIRSRSPVNYTERARYYSSQNAIRSRSPGNYPNRTRTLSFESISSGEKDWGNEACGRLENSGYGMARQTEVEVRKPKGSVPFVCHICKMFTDNNRTMLTHLESETHLKNAHIWNASENFGRKAYSCFICMAISSCDENYRMHLDSRDHRRKIRDHLDRAGAIETQVVPSNFFARAIAEPSRDPVRSKETTTQVYDPVKRDYNYGACCNYCENAEVCNAFEFTDAQQHYNLISNSPLFCYDCYIRFGSQRTFSDHLTSLRHLENRRNRVVTLA